MSATASSPTTSDMNLRHPNKPTRLYEITMAAMFLGFVIFLLWGLPALFRLVG